LNEKRCNVFHFGLFSNKNDNFGKTGREIELKINLHTSYMIIPYSSGTQISEKYFQSFHVH
jgi:hypothetical protein